MDSSDWVSTLLRLVTEADLHRHTPALRLRLQQLLPGGFPFSYFDQFPEFGVLKARHRVLRRLTAEKNIDALPQAATGYVSSFEDRLLNYFPPDYVCALEEYQRAFEQALLALSVLRPAPRLSVPLICVISGPSGSGKDTVLRRAIEWLQSRGHSARYLTKYVNRSPREAEAGGHPLFRYQVHVGRVTECDSSSSSDAIDAVADAFFKYHRYGNWYAFSRADLEAFAATRNPPIMFAVMSEYPRLAEFWNEARSILDGTSKPLTGISFLLEATEDRSITSLVHRLISRAKEKPASFDEVYNDYQIRRAEVVTDHARIERGDEIFSNYINVCNRRSDNGLTASLQIYQYIGRSVVSREIDSKPTGTVASERV